MPLSLRRCMGCHKNVPSLSEVFHALIKNKSVQGTAGEIRVPFHHQDNQKYCR